MTKTNLISRRTFFLASLTLVLVVARNLHAQGPLMRFPDIHEDLIVFVHGEDIWSVPAQGGIATRLTIHDGQERFPKFSNDGALIAFTAEYDGNTDVYVMNRHGGDITRVTWHPGNDEVVGWHPEKNKILFMSSRSNFPRLNQLYLISPDGTGLEKLIFHEASQGTYSPDGKNFAYNKTSREFRTWKRYKGGTAQEIYLYDFETDEEKNLTNFEGTDRIPMWWGDKIYFSSDRDRVLNIYSAHLANGQIEQLTSHTDYDVRRPSIGGSKIIYELGGTLRVLDLKNGQTQKVDVQILADAPELRPYFKNVKRDLTEIGSSPDGKTALLVARGEIFTVTLHDSTTINHIDGRSNGGGLDPDIFFRRLMRAPHSYWTRRYSHDQTSPVYGVRAHMVCLTNRQAGSGGDEFPEEFQRFNMGPVIGTRTWGGLVGVSMFLSMIDGGGLTAPDYRIYDENGKWIVENEGVTPDIILDNKPAEMARGYDAQLMKGVGILMKKIEEEPIVWPEHEPFPADN